jgi:hypothetical protein
MKNESIRSTRTMHYKSDSREQNEYTHIWYESLSEEIKRGKRRVYLLRMVAGLDGGGAPAVQGGRRNGKGAAPRDLPSRLKCDAAAPVTVQGRRPERRPSAPCDSQREQLGRGYAGGRGCRGTVGDLGLREVGRASVAGIRQQQAGSDGWNGSERLWMNSDM